ncbi:MAG: hypothetical protein V3U35_01000 [Candidatus Neomarinimicrobiota bacterium]
MASLSTIIAELKRRRVFRVAAFYGGIAFVIVQIIDGTFEVMGVPSWLSRLLIVLLAAGFPVAMGLAWVFDITPEGIVRTGDPAVDPRGQGKSQPGSGKSLTSNRALIVVAVLAVAFGVWSRWGGDGAMGPLALSLKQTTFSEGIEGYPAFSPDGMQLAYSQVLGRVRHIFTQDLATGAVTQVTTGAADDLQPAWSPDGETILFVRARQQGVMIEPGDVFGVYEEGDIWTFDLASGVESKLIDNAFNPDYSPNGQRIAFDASWTGPRRIWATDRLGRNPQQLSFDSSEVVSQLRPRWSPDGSRITYQNMEWTKFDIKVITLATNEATWVTNDGFQDLNPAWSADGTGIFFSSYRSGGLNIWRMPMTRDGSPAGEARQVTTGAGQDVELALTRNGDRLAFSALRQNADLWRIPVDPETGRTAGPPQQVLATTREDSRGAWSPDGSQIAFNSDRAGDMNIWVHDLVNNTTRQITTGAGGDFQPNWSPDGNRLVFFSSRAGNPDIWVVDIAAADMRQLTRHASIDINPAYSPDGRHIAFQSDREGRREVWLINADGTGQRQLTEVGVTGHFLRWSQDGARVIFKVQGTEEQQLYEVGLNGGPAVLYSTVAGGSHFSFNPDLSAVVDVSGHKTLWLTPLPSGQPLQVFQFDDTGIRIDYPVWSTDGRWILFDRFTPQGGDIWLMENFE